ncbi:MAG: ABC transporter permease [Capsulimonas sp.]|uniref:ABC transporter permease n=1 Tax=Capsulimonas sp. TaxID=2494211 RepID=UPI003264FC48
MSQPISPPLTSEPNVERAAARAARLDGGRRAPRWASAGGVFLLVAVLAILGRILSPDFLTSGNLLNMLRAVTLLGIVAIGATFVTYSGHYIDLSTPAMMALSGIATVAALPLGIVPAIACGLFAGVAVGAINGAVVGYLRLNPIIWTLAMAAMIDGLIRWGFHGKQVYPDEGTVAGRLMVAMYAAQLPGGVPVIVAVLGALALLGWFLMNRTAFGARVRLVGSAYEAARMTGLDVRALVALAFVVSSATAAVGGILLTSLNKVGAAYIGSGYDFMAVTAVVIGGVTLNGGRGSIPGALGGVLVIGLLRNIMTLIGIGSFGQLIVQGIVFIAAVGASAYTLRRAGRDDS